MDVLPSLQCWATDSTALQNGSSMVVCSVTPCSSCSHPVPAQLRCMIFLKDEVVLPINAFVTALISFFVGVPAIFKLGFIFNVVRPSSINPLNASTITGLPFFITWTTDGGSKR